ncbi:hypothetical protein GCM10023334_061020 [Nonomuraea thailandensis]
MPAGRSEGAPEGRGWGGPGAERVTPAPGWRPPAEGWWESGIHRRGGAGYAQVQGVARVGVREFRRGRGRCARVQA